LAGGAVVTLLLVLSALLPPAELVVGVGRRNLSGHLRRLVVWAVLPSAVLILAFVWSLEGFSILETQGWSAMGLGFWVAGAGAVLELLGSLFIHR
jgi:hypothetical protein